MLSRFLRNQRCTPIELGLGFLFILYLLLPIEFPLEINLFLRGSLGLTMILVITVYLFMVMQSPMLGVLYILVAYEMLRRSEQSLTTRNFYNTPGLTPETNANLVSSDRSVEPPQTQKQTQIQIQTPSTLEEEIIGTMAPVGRDSSLGETSAVPYLTQISYASLYN
jgi:hypothetical protein